MIRPTFKQYSFSLLKNASPFLFSFLLLLIGLFPVRVPFFVDMYVPMVIVSLFYWIIVRPDLMRPLFVFILGFFSDVMYQNPLGFHSLLFLLFYVLIASQRRFLINRSFLFLWGAFSILLIPYFLLRWCLASLLFLTFMPFWAMIGQILLLIGLFPVIGGICAKMYVHYLEDVE